MKLDLAEALESYDGEYDVVGLLTELAEWKAQCANPTVYTIIETFEDMVVNYL